MRNKFITLFLSIVFSIGIFAKNNCKASIYENNWGNVATFIQHNWHKSVIDSTEILWLGAMGIIPTKPYMTVS